ncbi:MAG: hypothetical protein AMXMBFR16_06840 [Candidatus Uhrbacteria bacterium]|nr:MAG: hypothetical protein DCC77_03360 [Candidatus Uhrbacteria bacterium]
MEDARNMLSKKNDEFNATMKPLQTFVFAMFSLAALVFFAAPASAYDIKKDYCGVIVKAAYCKCAFHNQLCAGVGMSQTAANAYVQHGFDVWVREKECVKNGGAWIKDANICRMPEIEEPEPMMPPEPAETEDSSDAGDNDDGTKKAASQCNEANHEVENKDGQCECAPLYGKDEDGACGFQGSRGVSFDAESADAFQDAIEGLGKGEGTVFEGRNAKGEPVHIGILRLPNGEYVFTANGLNWFESVKDAVSPGLLTKLGTGWENMRRTIGMWFGIGKFTGRDTAGNPDAQRDGQAMLDAASKAFQALKATAKDPEAQFDTAREALGTWLDRAKNLLGEDGKALVHDGLGSATGLDTKLIENVSEGNWSDIADDTLDSAKKTLYAVPAETIKTLSRELTKNDFANSARAYAEERRAGKSPEEILAGLLRGDEPILEALQLKGTGNIYTKTALFMAYEDAYQRYRIRTLLDEGARSGK